MYFWKNSLSPFQGPWGQEAIFEVAEAKFWISSIFNEFSFRIFSKITFLKSVRSNKKMRYVTASWSKFSLNLSTEEVWQGQDSVHVAIGALILMHSVARMWISRKKRWQQILKNHTYKGIESPIPIPPLGIVRLRAPIVLGSLLTK